MNCVYISYDSFIAVLIYFVHYIQRRNALIFRTLCLWLYEVLAHEGLNVIFPKDGMEEKKINKKLKTCPKLAPFLHQI